MADSLARRDRGVDLGKAGAPKHVSETTAPWPEAAMLNATLSHAMLNKCLKQLCGQGSSAPKDSRMSALAGLGVEARRYSPLRLKL